MIRIILFSILLFLVEVAVFRAYSGDLLQALAGIDIKYLNFDDKQRRVLDNIQRIEQNNSKDAPIIYTFGSSTTREFFYLDRQMQEDTGKVFVNLGGARQTLYDSIRLLDNIEGSDVTIIYCLFPMRFMRSSLREPVDSRYLMGAYLKYPIESSYIDGMLAEVEPLSYSSALVEELNVFCYLLKNYCIDLSRRLKIRAVYGSRYGSDILVNKRPPPQHYYHRRQKGRDSLAKELFVRKKEINLSLEANLQTNFQLLEDFLELCRQRGHTVKLLELPYSSTFNRYFQKEITVYRKFLNDFREQHSSIDFTRIDYSSYQGDEKFFFDHGHLLTRGRDYFNPLIKNFLL